jgi:hypothetical protein
MPQTINYDTISDKIILCSNSKNGNNMYFKISIPKPNLNPNVDVYRDYLYNDISNNINNKIILFRKYKKNVGNTTNEENFFGITENHLYNNIKFFFLNNDFNKPRLLFHKYKYKFIYSHKYIIPASSFSNIFKNFNLFYNFYKNYRNSEYYKIKLSDFSLNNTNNSTSILNGVDLTNNYQYINRINYNDISNNFRKLFYQNSDIDLSVNILNNNDIINDNSNILIYNKLNNITTTKFSNSYYKDLSFVLIKTSKLNNKNYGKILLYDDCIYINGLIIDSSNIIDLSNNSSLNLIKHSFINDKIGPDASNNKIFLSLGNGVTGITQNDIFKKMYINFNNYKIKIGDSGNTIIYNNSNNNNMSNNNYLLNNDYNYDYININYFNYQIKSKKFANLTLNNYFNELNFTDISNINTYYDRFKNLELLNNNLNLNYIDNSLNYQFNKVKYIIESGNNDITKFSSSIPLDDIKINITDNFLELANINNRIFNELKYDFRYNYGITFDICINFLVKYSLFNDEKNTNVGLDYDYSNNLLLNFYKTQLLTQFTTANSSDFTNVDCIFTYNDPINSTNANYLYPNNNIDICRNADIDTLTKAIQLLPGARTATTNSIFIPAKNGSNLSRKHIQGLIGFGNSNRNVARLLSIEPYDENFINGRGFINQFRIENECLTEEQLINKKIESQKHSSVKNKNLLSASSKQRYANLARNGPRNNLARRCFNEENPQQSSQTIRRPILTPFRLFKTGKGHYLGPK